MLALTSAALMIGRLPQICSSPSLLRHSPMVDLAMMCCFQTTLLSHPHKRPLSILPLPSRVMATPGRSIRSSQSFHRPSTSPALSRHAFFCRCAYCFLNRPRLRRFMLQAQAATLPWVGMQGRENTTICTMRYPSALSLGLQSSLVPRYYPAERFVR